MQAVNENYLYEVQDYRRGAEAANSQLSALVVKAQSGAELTDAERRQYFSHMIRGLNAWNLAYSRYKDGLISAESWPGWDRMYGDQARNDFPQEWWEEARLWYTEDFVANVDASGDGDLLSIHASLPVKQGAKWLTTLWLREKPFQYPAS